MMPIIWTDSGAIVTTLISREEMLAALLGPPASNGTGPRQRRKRAGVSTKGRKAATRATRKPTIAPKKRKARSAAANKKMIETRNRNRQAAPSNNGSTVPAPERELVSV